MSDGFKNLRRGLEVMMHTIINDAARDIAARINRTEPALDVKPSRVNSGSEIVEIAVSGVAELSKDKHDSIKQMIETSIDDALNM